MGGQSVARPALIFSFTVPLLRTLMTAKRSRDAFLGVTKSHVQRFSAVVCMGRPLRARVLIEILRILMGEPSVAHARTRSCARCLTYTVASTFWVRSDLRTRLGVTEARAQNIPAIECTDGPHQVRVAYDVIHHLDGRVFYVAGLPAVIVARHAISEVPLRANTLECFAQAP
jgi:hypothetical protein